MHKLAAIIAVVATVAGAADYQSAVVKQVETTTTNTVPWNGKGWTTDGLFKLTAGVGGSVIRADNWNVPGMAAPSEAQIVAWAEADAGAYRKAKKDAEVIVIDPPSLNTSYGTAERPLAEMHVASNTVYIGGQPIKADADGIKLKASKTGSGWNPQGQLQARLEAIEKILGLREE